MLFSPHFMIPPTPWSPMAPHCMICWSVGPRSKSPLHGSSGDDQSGAGAFGKGTEQIGAHPGDVAHVVAHVVLSTAIDNVAIMTRWDTHGTAMDTPCHSVPHNETKKTVLGIKFLHRPHMTSSPHCLCCWTACGKAVWTWWTCLKHLVQRRCPCNSCQLPIWRIWHNII